MSLNIHLHISGIVIHLVNEVEFREDVGNE